MSLAPPEARTSIRSARAVSLNGMPLASGKTISPRRSTQTRSTSPRDSRSKSRTKSRLFSMLGQFRAANAGSALSGGESGARDGKEHFARLGREGAGGVFLREFLQRGVPRFACLARPELALDRVQRLETENELGVDRVRVAPQGLNSRDAEPGRAKRNRRTGRRPRSRPRLGRPVERARELEIALAALLGFISSLRRLRPPPRRCAGESGRRRSARRPASSRGSRSPPAPRARRQNRARSGRCAAPAPKGRARRASAG